jgi:hypothetical protein
MREKRQHIWKRNSRPEIFAQRRESAIKDKTKEVTIVLVKFLKSQYQRSKVFDLQTEKILRQNVNSSVRQKNSFSEWIAAKDAASLVCQVRLMPGLELRPSRIKFVKTTICKIIQR